MATLLKEIQKPGVPKYLQIRENFITSLRDGKYKIGHRLPSQSEMAKEFDVSLLTVRQAIGLLEQDGIVSSEQGRGTYVKSVEPVSVSEPARKSVYAFKNIVYLLVDHPPEVPFYKNQVRAIESELAKYKANLVFASLSSEQIISGVYSASLHSDFASGVIVDGFVKEIHIHFLKNLKIPFVVLGSHSVKQEVLSVRFDLSEAVYLMCSEYFKRFSGGRLLFFTEPFRLDYSHELYSGYQRACTEVRADDGVHLVYDESKSSDVLINAIQKASLNGRPFGLLLHVDVASKAYEIYCELGLSMEEHPIFVIGKAEYVSPELRNRLNLCGLDLDLETSAATESLFSAIGGKPVSSIMLKPQLSIQNEPEWNVTVDWTCNK